MIAYGWNCPAKLSTISVFLPARLRFEVGGDRVALVALVGTVTVKVDDELRRKMRSVSINWSHDR